MTVVYREHCDGCRKLLPVSTMTAVCKQVAKRTHSSPAEYEDVMVCDDCLREDERDPDYERACLRFKETHGGEL